MRFSELIALTWDDVDEVREQVKTYRRYNTSIHKVYSTKKQYFNKISSHYFRYAFLVKNIENVTTKNKQRIRHCQ